MPYTTPPTFVDTNVLSATQLNTLSDDIEWLYGQAVSVNVPFVSPPWVDEPWSWTIRHKARYLNVYLSYNLPVIPGPFTEYKIFINYDGDLVSTTDLVIADPSPIYITVDLDAFGPYTYGDWFTIEIDIEHPEWGADAVTIQRVFESSTDESV
jgi:hypothetical protein